MKYTVDLVEAEKKILRLGLLIGDHTRKQNDSNIITLMKDHTAKELIKKHDKMGFF